MLTTILDILGAGFVVAAVFLALGPAAGIGAAGAGLLLASWRLSR